MMNNLELTAFIDLVKKAYAKCFSYPLQSSLSETDSKFFSNEILEKTGLTIGWKSLKNYSSFATKNADDKQENPSVATLDTLARYVMDAPISSEIQRKRDEGHYPFWFRYKDQFHQPTDEKSLSIPKRYSLAKIIVFAGPTTLFLIFFTFYWFFPQKPTNIKEDFRTVADDSLADKGWFIQSKDKKYWNQRGEKAGHLALFTLKGDNWPDSLAKPIIKNLLLRKMPSDNFTIEAQLTDFVPLKNWQQAGILLLEDSSFRGKSVRLSLAYNDFSGGFPTAKQILIQAITSTGNGMDKPEEISHHLVFSVNNEKETLLAKGNLKHSAFRIEKHGNKWRFLFACGTVNNPAFKEIISHEFDILPKYVGVFALKGFVNDSTVIPAYFKSFSLVKD